MSENSTSGMIDYSKELSKLLPYSSAALVFLGTSKLYFYYSRFGINIVSFLDFGEVITSFLDVVIALIFVLSYSWIQFVSPTKNEPVEILNGDNDTRKNKRKNEIFWILMILLNLGVVIYLSYEWAIRNYRTFIFFIIVTLVAILFVRVLLRIVKNTSSNFYKQLAKLSIVVLVSEMLIIFLSFSEYTEVVYNDKYLDTKIQFNSEVLNSDGAFLFTSDKTKFYIGNTSNYIFIYDSKSKVTEIIPMSKVVKIAIKHNNKNEFKLLPL